MRAGSKEHNAVLINARFDFVEVRGKLGADPPPPFPHLLYILTYTKEHFWGRHNAVLINARFSSTQW